MKTILALLVLSFAHINALALYYNPGCPHCHEVLAYLKSSGKTLPLKSTENPEYSRELESFGGTGVPALEVDGRLIKGSSGIISYLKNKGT